MSKFLLLLGPSGAGKSTIIDELCKLDDRFIFISPFTTRPLREMEKGKVSISDEEMDERLHRGEFLAVNLLYAARYATPLLPIIEALAIGHFPVLDWPVGQVNTITRAFPGRSHIVYIAPPSLEVLCERLKSDDRDIGGRRLEHARRELEDYWSGKYANICDFEVITTTGKVPEITQSIYSSYLRSFT